MSTTALVGLRRRLPLTRAALLVVAMSVQPLAAQKIDTGHDPGATIGGPSIPGASGNVLHGEFFTAPLAGSGGGFALTSFSLGVQVDSPLDVRFGVALWNGGLPGGIVAGQVPPGGPLFGPVLHTSPVVSLAASPTSVMRSYVLPAPLPLVGGQTYLAFLDIRGTGTSGSGNMELRPGDPYASGGSYVLYGNGTFEQRQPNDFAFTATFAVVPEPAPLTLTMIGAAALGGLGARRRRRA